MRDNSIGIRIGSEEILRNENVLAIDVNAHSDIGLGRIQKVFLMGRTINKALDDLPGQHDFALPADSPTDDLIVSGGLLNGSVAPHPPYILGKPVARFSVRTLGQP